MAVFNNRAGDQSFRGQASEYDQVDYSGNLADYAFTQNANGSVTVTHPTLGTDTLFDINGFWFNGESAWYSIEDAIRLTTDAPYIDESGAWIGTQGNDVLRGTAGTEDIFYADMGNDRIIGGGDEYDQAEYDGELIEYTFTRLNNGDVTVSHPTWGMDTLSDIDGMWFTREGAWYSIEDAIEITSGLPRFRLDADDVLNGTPGNDRMQADASGTNFYGGTGNDTFLGRNNAYDQVNYDGDLADYSVQTNANGIVIITSALWGRDTLSNIDGIYFNGPNGGWVSIDDLEDQSATADIADADFGAFF